jgi:hypothetical protein
MNNEIPWFLEDLDVKWYSYPHWCGATSVLKVLKNMKNKKERPRGGFSRKICGYLWDSLVSECLTFKSLIHIGLFEF